jgi:hypothetical protein
MLLAVLYFPVSGGRPALQVPSPAAIYLLLTSLVTTSGPLVGPARPTTCNYPFTIPTGLAFRSLEDFAYYNNYTATHEHLF